MFEDIVSEVTMNHYVEKKGMVQTIHENNKK